MATGGFSLSQFLQPTDFLGFIATVLVIRVEAGIGNGSIFKMIPLVNPREASAMIGIVGCRGAFGGFVPPLLLAYCFSAFGSPAWAYTLDGGLCDALYRTEPLGVCPAREVLTH